MTPWILIGVSLLVVGFIVVAIIVWIRSGTKDMQLVQEMERVQEYRPESWCFVGEDVVGRWCVRVPFPQSCTPDRLFDSEDSCTYVPASALPLGVVKEGGAEYKPFAPPMPAMANTF